MYGLLVPRMSYNSWLADPGPQWTVAPEIMISGNFFIEDSVGHEYTLS